MLDVSDKNLELLRDNLETLRTTAGWSLAELGDMIDVNKQTIRNLEMKKTKMTKLQYFALKAIFDEESENNEKLNTIMKIVFEGDDIDTENKEKAMAFAKGAAKTDINSTMFATCIGTLLGITVATLPALLKALTRKD